MEVVVYNIDHMTEQRTKRVPSGNTQCTFLGPSKLLIYLTNETKVLYKTWKIMNTLLWSNLLGVVIHVFPVVPPLVRESHY